MKTGKRLVLTSVSIVFLALLIVFSAVAYLGFLKAGRKTQIIGSGVEKGGAISFDGSVSGSLTVSVHKNDGLSLSETPDFFSPVFRLGSGAERSFTNFDGSLLPEGLDNVNGKHSGDDYVAYTFYCRNDGALPAGYVYEMNISDMTQGIEKAIRVRLFVNGEESTYAYPRTDGGEGPEPGTLPFYTGDAVLRKAGGELSPGGYDRFTVVIWLEGNDPDCVDRVIGGRFAVDMTFSLAAPADGAPESAA